MQEYQTEILLRPDSSELRFLPEGPYTYGENKFSWVGIQHGGDSTTGSVNVYDFSTGENTTYNLNGRPGFAFPTTRKNTFVMGLERRLALVNLDNGEEEVMCDNIDGAVENTIINDGLAFDGGLIFGAKELSFT